MQPDWQAALRDGVERAKGLAWPKPSLDLAYYGDVFLADTDNKMGKGGLQVPEVLDADVVAFLKQLQDEIVDSSQPLDVQEPTKGLAKGLPAPLTPLAAWLERRFGLAGKLLFFGDLVQVRRFQRDDELAETVLDRVREMLPQNPRVLAGHSLGSIVAYEALCRIPDHGVTTLITLGSPLGLRSIRQGMSRQARDRMPDLPPGVLRWVNIYDPRDAVSLAGGLAAYWPMVADKNVDNGDEPHAVTNYLGGRPSKPERGNGLEKRRPGRFLLGGEVLFGG
jgi:pimeloyl-ACP methyl ester carboxylesterase